MKDRNGRVKKAVTVILLATMMISLIIVGASCGTREEKSTGGSSSTKLPLGTTEESLEETSTTRTTAEPSDSSGSEESDTISTTSTSTPMVTLDLAGARFTMVSAERKTSNSDVVSGDAREVDGDYMEIELEVENVGTDLLDLGDFSFRLYSPGIEADEYYDYYGDTGTYGEYVSSHTISGSLLDYSNLSPVSYVLKIGETVDGLFLFYDLNPDSTQQNAGVTKDNSKLVIKKVSGSDYGDYIDMGLIGYPDE